MSRKHLKLSTAREIRSALSRIANMVLNEELDHKQANTITYICNVALSALKAVDIDSIIKQEGTTMKTNRQYSIQALLRMAEITGDENQRDKWLSDAERLLNADAGDLVTGIVNATDGVIIEVTPKKSLATLPSK